MDSVPITAKRWALIALGSVQRGLTPAFPYSLVIIADVLSLAIVFDGWFIKRSGFPYGASTFAALLALSPIARRLAIPNVLEADLNRGPESPSAGALPLRAPIIESPGGSSGIEVPDIPEPSEDVLADEGVTQNTMSEAMKTQTEEFLDYIPAAEVVFIRVSFSVPIADIDAASLESLDPLIPDGEPTSEISIDVASVLSSDSLNYIAALTDPVPGLYRLNLRATDQTGVEQSSSTRFRIVEDMVQTALNPGWTLISLPKPPLNAAINDLLVGTTATQVWGFNNAAQIWEFARMNKEGDWEGTLTEMSEGRAYFIRSVTFDPIKYLPKRSSPGEMPNAYAVVKGWNAIGFIPSAWGGALTVEAYLAPIRDRWAVCRVWDPATRVYESVWPTGEATFGFPRLETGEPIVEAGKGYLLYATGEGSLIPG